jgi:hypothetical protein
MRIAAACAWGTFRSDARHAEVPSGHPGGVEVLGIEASRARPFPEIPATPRHPAEELRALGQMARRLEMLYSTCVTVELALQQQRGGQDEDIARCLMRNVTAPLSEHAEALPATVRSLKRRGAGPGFDAQRPPVAPSSSNAANITYSIPALTLAFFGIVRRLLK